MNSKILVTAFRPFLHHTVNSSERVLASLATERADIEPLLLPVSFQNSFVEFKTYWQKHGPFRAIVLLGQANGRPMVSLERVALNWMESKNPDNDGECPPGGRIISGAPDSYLVDFFPSSWKETVSAASGNAGAKLAEVSLTAGAYVCNNLYFKVIHELRNSNANSSVKALFVHLPLLPEQVQENPTSPSLDLHTQKHVVNEILNLISTLR